MIITQVIRSFLNKQKHVESLLETRWKRHLVTEVYKATHNLTPSYITSLFPSKIIKL